jgi:DNA-binding CsgD family transcriptional regulator
MDKKYIYALTDNGKIFYIGQAVNAYVRLDGHVYSSKKLKSQVDKRIQDIITNDRELDVLIIKMCLPCDALRLEKETIKRLSKRHKLLNYIHVTKYSFDEKKLKVLQLLADDHTASQISKITGLTGKSIEAIKNNMKKIAKVRTIGGLIYYGYKNKLIS